MPWSPESGEANRKTWVPRWAKTRMLMGFNPFDVWMTFYFHDWLLTGERPSCVSPTVVSEKALIVYLKQPTRAINMPSSTAWISSVAPWLLLNVGTCWHVARLLCDGLFFYLFSCIFSHCSFTYYLSSIYFCYSDVVHFITCLLMCFSFCLAFLSLSSVFWMKNHCSSSRLI